MENAMYEVVVKQGRKIVARKTFTSELAAWDYVGLNEDRYEVEFRNLNYLPK
jgi:hypothetical protein